MDDQGVWTSNATLFLAGQAHAHLHLSLTLRSTLLDDPLHVNLYKWTYVLHIEICSDAKSGHSELIKYGRSKWSVYHGYLTIETKEIRKQQGIIWQ